MDRRLTGVAVAHAAVATAHGVPHASAGVWLAGWQYAVVTVTALGPVAAGLGADRRPRLAGRAAAGLFAGSVAFGVTHHWVLAGADNVKTVGSAHRAAFEGTAVLLAVVGLLGAAVAYSSSSSSSAAASMSSM